MPSVRPPCLALVATALLAATVARADSIRCEGGIVSAGDSKLDLLGKCGQPALREDVGEALARTRVDGPTRTSRSTASAVERWTYNFGPRQFVQVVTLEAGTVTRVERGSYGYDLGQARAAPPTIRRATCNHLGFHEGDTAFELLARCGEPAALDLKVVSVRQATGTGPGQVVVEERTSTVELWTYDFGPSTLVRRLTLADGKVVKVETGGYGYSR